VLFGECLSGALYWNDFVRLAQKVGFLDPRLVKDAKITIDNKALEEKIGYIDFFRSPLRFGG
jgi:arsenite methyltransferase